MLFSILSWLTIIAAASASIVVICATTARQEKSTFVDYSKKAKINEMITVPTNGRNDQNTTVKDFSHISKSKKIFSNDFVWMQNLLLSNQDDGKEYEIESKNDPIKTHYIERKQPSSTSADRHYNNAITIFDAEKYNKIVLNFTTISKHEASNSSIRDFALNNTINQLLSPSNKIVDSDPRISLKDSLSKREDNWEVVIKKDYTKNHGNSWIFESVSNANYSIEQPGDSFNVPNFKNYTENQKDLSLRDSSINETTPYLSIYNDVEKLGISLKTQKWISENKNLTEDFKTGTLWHTRGVDTLILSFIPYYENFHRMEDGVTTLVTNERVRLYDKMNNFISSSKTNSK